MSGSERPGSGGPGVPPLGAPPPDYRSPDVARRLGNTVKALFSLHRDLLEEEARADLRRLGLIAGLGGAAAAMGFVSAMSLGVVVILGIQRLSGLPLLESVAIGMGGTILLMLLLLASAVSLFRKPFLRRSRLLLTRTWASLTRDDPDGPPPGGPASVAEA